VGAMQKVMQKLQATTGAAGAENPAAAAPNAAETSPETRSPGPASSGAAGGAGFVPDPLPGAAPAGGAAKAPPAAWNLNRIDRALVAFHDRYGAVAEQYRSLRARLLNMNPQGKRQVIAITSSLPQEGKSVTTINLAAVMAEGHEHQVLILDGDLRRASLARMLALDPEPGLADLIRGEADWAAVVRPTPLPNLKVITAGSVADKNYGRLVSSSALRSILGRLREQFDYAFMDTPPVNTVSDVSMLAPHCDGAILVIEMCRTPEPSVLEAVRTLQTTNVKLLGCVLSRFEDQRGHYYERYYSYYNSE